MDNKLARLISDYQEKVNKAVILMKRSGIPMPATTIDWVTKDIPYRGELDNGIKYFKHGAGCLVSLDTGDVEFDFGYYGEVGGFNEWWLIKFAGKDLSNYGFKNEHEVYEIIKSTLAVGKLEYSQCGLYFIANTPRTYAVDIDCRLLNDMLPDRNKDHVLTLNSHYFQTAVVMFEHYERLRKKK